MAFKTPVNSTLTESQEKSLSKLGSINTYLGAPNKSYQNLSKDQQISTFDFSVRALDSLIGNNASEIILQQFLLKIFDHTGPDKTLLEELVVKSMAKSLDAKGKKVSKTQSNEQWLMANVLPVLTIGKRLLAKQIITMVFGPKQVMAENPVDQDRFLNYAACGEKTFSVTNNPSVSEKELEFNRVNLKEQLDKGEVQLTISCQKVKISLPENFEEQFGLQDSSSTNIAETRRPNPGLSFVLLSNYVQSETRSQRTEEDATAVRRGFFNILINKLFQYISVSLTASNDLNSSMDLINTNLANNGYATESKLSMTGSPCDITNACGGDKEKFNQVAAFSSSMINSLYALVVSMLVRKLISEAKKKIKKVLAEKARERALKTRRRQKQKFKHLNESAEKANKSKQFAANLKSIQDLFNFNNS